MKLKCHYVCIKAQARCNRPTPSHPTVVRYFLILHSCLHLRFPSSLLCFCCISNSFYAFLIFVMSGTRPACTILHGSVTIIILIQECELLSTVFCNFLQICVTLSVVGPQTILGYLM